jgi:hypothetical protein
LPEFLLRTIHFTDTLHGFDCLHAGTCTVVSRRHEPTTPGLDSRTHDREDC